MTLTVWVPTLQLGHGAFRRRLRSLGRMVHGRRAPDHLGGSGRTAEADRAGGSAAPCGPRGASRAGRTSCAGRPGCAGRARWSGRSLCAGRACGTRRSGWARGSLAAGRACGTRRSGWARGSLGAGRTGRSRCSGGSSGSLGPGRTRGSCLTGGPLGSRRAGVARRPGGTRIRSLLGEHRRPRGGVPVGIRRA